MPHQARADTRTLPDIIVTRKDAERLDSLTALLLGMSASSGVELLLQELLRAQVVEAEEIPASTVRMHSVVEFRDEDSGTDRVVRLVYPGEQKAYRDAVSVVAPVGAALIGLSEGQSISYLGADKRPRSITVLRVLSGAPGNASGDRH
jgi:regulator of nucleoside diphosphate kinase